MQSCVFQKQSFTTTAVVRLSGEYPRNVEVVLEGSDSSLEFCAYLMLYVMFWVRVTGWPGF